MLSFKTFKIPRSKIVDGVYYFNIIDILTSIGYLKLAKPLLTIPLKYFLDDEYVQELGIFCILVKSKRKETSDYFDFFSDLLTNLKTKQEPPIKKEVKKESPIPKETKDESPIVKQKSKCPNSELFLKVSKLVENNTPIRGWILKDKLGEGSFGVVYSCYKWGIEQNLCAIKLEISKKSSMLYNESEVYSLLNKKGLGLRKIESGVYSEYNFIVLELGEVPEKVLSKKFIRDIFEHIAELNSYGLEHADIKFGNMLVRKRDGKFVLCDFGLSNFWRNLKGTLGTRTTMSINAHNKIHNAANDIESFAFCIILMIHKKTIWTITPDKNNPIESMKKIKEAKEIYRRIVVENTDLSKLNFGVYEKLIKTLFIESLEINKGAKANLSKIFKVIDAIED